MFWIVILLITFSPENKSDKVKKRKGTHPSLVCLKMPLTDYHPIKVHNMVSVVGCYHQRGSDSSTLQLQVQCVDVTVTKCGKKDMNRTQRCWESSHSILKSSQLGTRDYESTVFLRCLQLVLLVLVPDVVILYWKMFFLMLNKPSTSQDH